MTPVPASGEVLSVCKWCAGQAWYTSWFGGFAQRKPCEHCNYAGTVKADAARAQVSA